jgi:hypothetical protein
LDVLINEMGDHGYTLKAAQDLVPTLEKYNSTQNKDSKLEVFAWDIDGMFPNMPKEHIMEAMRIVADDTFAKAPNRMKQITIPHAKVRTRTLFGG